jgi:hypothetical protein
MKNNDDDDHDVLKELLQGTIGEDYKKIMEKFRKNADDLLSTTKKRLQQKENVNQMILKKLQDIKNIVQMLEMGILDCQNKVNELNYNISMLNYEKQQLLQKIQQSNENQLEVSIENLNVQVEKNEEEKKQLIDMINNLLNLLKNYNRDHEEIINPPDPYPPFIRKFKNTFKDIIPVDDIPVYPVEIDPVVKNEDEEFFFDEEFPVDEKNPVVKSQNPKKPLNPTFKSIDPIDPLNNFIDPENINDNIDPYTTPIKVASSIRSKQIRSNSNAKNLTLFYNQGCYKFDFDYSLQIRELSYTRCDEENNNKLQNIVKILTSDIYETCLHKGNLLYFLQLFIDKNKAIDEELIMKTFNYEDNRVQKDNNGLHNFLYFLISREICKEDIIGWEESLLWEFIYSNIPNCPPLEIQTPEIANVSNTLTNQGGKKKRKTRKTRKKRKTRKTRKTRKRRSK